MELQPRQTYERQVAGTRAERMQWWNEARYGMFVHWGLYALLGRNEWVRAIECIPQDEYDQLTGQFRPKPAPAREWAQLAAEAGMKYMVMTTKHHEGYCLWDTKQTDYNAVKQGPGRDLVAEYVDACREFGLKIGFYYSLMDWHHPAGGRGAFDPRARGSLLDFTHGCVRELMSNYGKIDILWYDVALPFESHEGWDSLEMNQMVRELQPHILINNRSRLAEDFSTPEGRVHAAEEGRGWEACMTFNERSWGYMPSADVDSWTARDILRMLNTASAGGGNLLLNIGPAPDGSVPEAAIEPLRSVGKWLEANGEAVYGRLDRAGIRRASACGAFSRRGTRCYFWVHCWPGSQFALGGFLTRLERAWMLASGEPVEFEQKGHRIVLKGLPEKSPDRNAGVTVIALEFAEPPKHVHCADSSALHGGATYPEPE